LADSDETPSTVQYRSFPFFFLFFAFLVFPWETRIATATVVEIGAYYVPFLDNLLDAISTPAAVLAGMIASASVLVDLPPWLQYPIGIVGAGGTAGVVESFENPEKFRWR